jgi:hypothetical protein
MSSGMFMTMSHVQQPLHVCLILQQTLDATKHCITRIDELTATVTTLQRELLVGDMPNNVRYHAQGMKELLKYLKFNEPSQAVDAFLGCIQIQDLLAQHYCRRITEDCLDQDNKLVIKDTTNLSCIVVQYLLLCTFTTHFLGHSSWGNESK